MSCISIASMYEEETPIIDKETHENYEYEHIFRNEGVNKELSLAKCK